MSSLMSMKDMTSKHANQAQPGQLDAALLMCSSYGVTVQRPDTEPGAMGKKQSHIAWHCIALYRAC